MVRNGNFRSVCYTHTIEIVLSLRDLLACMAEWSKAVRSGRTL